MSNNNLNRRDFLKLASLLPGAMALSALAPQLLSNNQPASNKPNVIILLFDTMTAANLSLYGYRRETTPNFKRFAERANVYHAHNSAASFTSPGTASLLTGVYPWTHRAINAGGLIARNMLDHNLFGAFNDEYKRVAYSQNIWPNYFLAQFAPKLDTIIHPASFSTTSQVVGAPFKNPTAYRIYDDFLFQDGIAPASLLYGLIGRLVLRAQYFIEKEAQTDYPQGMPRAGIYSIYFELKKVFDGIFSTLEALQGPYLTYFHLWSPHSPYSPTTKFMKMFDDGWNPPRKPIHPLSSKFKLPRINTSRLAYDRYLANVDAEFGRLIDRLDERGILDNSYFVITSDHGEMFERGEEGHVTPLLFDPGIRIPLMISSPGQRSRKNFYSPTNCVDVLPTLLHLTGHEVPAWCEGSLLPGLGGKADPQRSTFTMDAKFNPAFSRLNQVSVAMRKGNYKLIYYKGYKGHDDSFELYDRIDDHNELRNLYPDKISEAASLKDELLEKLDSVDQKYRK